MERYPANIHLIKDKLVEFKFEEDLTLATLDEKTGQELLETLNTVFAHLSKDHEVDVRDEGMDVTAARMFNFLNVVLFQYPGSFEEFKEKLETGDRDLMYPLLTHVLSKLPELRKRAYLSRFLVPIDVPEEMFADPEVMEKWTLYKELQETFKETHKSTDRLRGTSMQPTELKREVTQLEEEKIQLKGKINKLEQKLKKLDNFQDLYDVTSKLRKEQEQEEKLAERLHEQMQQLKTADGRMYQARKKLQDLQAASVAGSSGEDMLSKLEDDVQMSRLLCDEKLPQDIHTKEQRLVQVQNLNKQQVSDADVRDQEQLIADKQSRLQDLQDELKRRQPAGDDKLNMFRQQRAIVERKKKDALERLQNTQDEVKEVQGDLDEKREKAGNKVVKVLKGAEFARYAEGLKAKAKIYKRKKTELSSIMVEKGILSRTEDILKTRHGDQSAFLAKLEREKGVEGATDLQSKLEQVSEQAQVVNETKAMTLEEISRTVADINSTIKDKKGKLAPLIKELRQVRTDFSELEKQYNQKKEVYEHTAVHLDSEREKLNTEVSAYNEECKREESRFHYLHAMMASTNNLLRRAQLEDQGKNRIGDAKQSYRELYQSRIQQQENLSKTLRERQKMVKESHDGNLEQAVMFNHLQRILSAKIDTMKKEQEGESLTTANGTNLMVMD